MRKPLFRVLLVVAIAPWLMAAGDSGDVARFFWVLAVMLVVGRFSAEFFERIGQPGVLGELIAGVILGGSVLGVIPVSPDDRLTEVFALLAEVGVVILLFEIGIETDLRVMRRVGSAATTVALVGVFAPFLLGLLYWFSPLHSMTSGADATVTAIFVGATLTATSVGITARVLTDLNVMRSLESRLIIGAAVIDDILGLVLLSVVSGLAAGAAVTVWGVAKTLGAALGFLVVAVVVGPRVAPAAFALADRMRVRGNLLVLAFAFVLILSALAASIGSALIIGAFAAGIILSSVNQFDVIHERIKSVADIFTPVFFITIGASVDLRVLNPFAQDSGEVFVVGLVLFGIAVVGKLVSGWAVWWRRFNRAAVGVGMVPRGEVGLIFAGIGRASGVFTTDLFNAMMLMIIGSTFVAPPLLKVVFARWGNTAVANSEGAPVGTGHGED